MKQSQKSGLWLGVIFLTCFLAFIILSNLHMTQVRERERAENENGKIKNEITGLYNERIKEMDVQIINYGLKNGVVGYSDQEVLDLK